MKKLIVFLLLILIIPHKSLAISDTDFINIKIGKTYQILEKIDISCDTNLALFQKDDLENEILVFDGYKVYVGKTFGVNSKIDIYDSYNQYITSIPSNGNVLIGPQLGYESTLNVGTKEYRGLISFIDDSMGLKIINHINIEHYLKGVLPKEIPPQSPIEALKAQAVAARSYAYSSMSKHYNEGYNLCDTTHCQVYGGFSDENINTSSAIEQTKDIVAKFNGSIANTVFHSSSGGFTESSEDIWGNKLFYLRGKEDPYSLNSNNSFWSVEIDKDLLCSSLNENGYGISQINDIKIIDTHSSGRVKKICINKDREEIILTGDKFRSLIGTNKLKSTLFHIEALDPVYNNVVYIKDKNKISAVDSIQILGDKGVLFKNNSNYNIIGKDNEVRRVDITSVNTNNDNIKISGKGYGHGVGMSQYGAIEMAKLGHDYIDILKFYYSDVDITKIN